MLASRLRYGEANALRRGVLSVLIAKFARIHGGFNSNTPHHPSSGSEGAGWRTDPMRKLIIAALLAGPFFAGSALAQTAAPSTQPPPAAKPEAKAKAPAKPRTAESLECSKQADAKGLHGKERKKFRADCKKDMAKKKS
jgi:hypothetical protein